MDSSVAGILILMLLLKILADDETISANSSDADEIACTFTTDSSECNCPRGYFHAENVCRKEGSQFRLPYLVILLLGALLTLLVIVIMSGALEKWRSSSVSSSSY